MLKKSIMWALICATAPVAYPQDDTATDSLDLSISPRLLEEVTVKAAAITDKTDRKIIRPDSETLRMSTDGMDLLRKLQLSRITVNPMTGNIEVTGGGDVILCINGVESTAAQFADIAPDDILRIEYHDNPGIRYHGAAAVIDCITRRHDSGGSLFLDGWAAFGRDRWASMDEFAAQYNKGRSVWSASASYMGQHKGSWIRDYDETWYYPDATLSRREEGLPVSVAQHELTSVLSYNYLHGSGDMFNANIGFDLSDVPAKEEGDRRALLITSGSDVPVLVEEHTESHSYRPYLGLYYMHRIADKQNLIVDGQGSWMHSRMLHDYSEDGIGESSRVDGDSYAMKLLAMYEQRSGSRAWSLGASGNGSWVNNRYRGDEEERVRVNRWEGALQGEYSDRLGNWGVLANASVAYRHLGQESRSIDRVCLLPSITISYRPADAWFLRYSASLDNKMPDAAEISDVEQPIQAGMVRRGNASLKPFRVIDMAFDASFHSSYFDIDARLDYRNEHSPVMESVIFEDGLFVRTFYNQRSFQRLIASGNVTLRPWKDHLSIMVTPTLTRYFSHGRDYRHCHNIYRTEFNVDFSYGHWLAYGIVFSGPANLMYSEEIIEEKNMNQIMAGYRADAWSLQAGVFNAFMSNYSMESHNLSSLAPFTSKAHSGRSNTYFVVKLTLSLSTGRKTRETTAPLPSPDLNHDPGILTTTK